MDDNDFCIRLRPAARRTSNFSFGLVNLHDSSIDSNSTFSSGRANSCESIAADHEQTNRTPSLQKKNRTGRQMVIMMIVSAYHHDPLPSVNIVQYSDRDQRRISEDQSASCAEIDLCSNEFSTSAFSSFD